MTTQTPWQPAITQHNLAKRTQTWDLEQAKAKSKSRKKPFGYCRINLIKFAADKRNSAIDALAKDLGKEFTAEEKTKFAGYAR